VTLGELTKWTVLRDWGPRRLADLAGCPSTTPGSPPAASSTNPLATFNTKDFADYAEHEGLSLIG